MDSKYKIVRIGHPPRPTKPTQLTSSILDNLLKEAKFLNHKLKTKNEEKTKQTNLTRDTRHVKMLNTPQSRSPVRYNNRGHPFHSKVNQFKSYRSHARQPNSFKLNFKLNNGANKKNSLDVNTLLGRSVNNLSRNKFKFIRPLRSKLFSNKVTRKPSVKSSFAKRVIKIKGVQYNINTTGNKLKRLQTKNSSIYKLNNTTNNRKDPARTRMLSTFVAKYCFFNSKFLNDLKTLLKNILAILFTAA